MIKNFFVNNVTFRKQDLGEGLIVSGEIANKTGKNFQSVVFRIVIFVKNKSLPAGRTLLTINGFSTGQVRVFEKKMEDLAYNEVINSITNCEILVESAY